MKNLNNLEHNSDRSDKKLHLSDVSDSYTVFWVVASPGCCLPFCPSLLESPSAFPSSLSCGSPFWSDLSDLSLSGLPSSDLSFLPEPLQDLQSDLQSSFLDFCHFSFSSFNQR